MNDALFFYMPKGMDVELWKRQVGDRLAQSISAIGKKPADIAKMFGISQQRLSNYIRGERPLDIVLAMKLSARFGFTLEWLYLGDIRSLPYELAQKIVPFEGGAGHVPN